MPLLLLLLLSHFSRVQLCVTPQTAAHQAPPSLDSPGKNTGVGCHFLLQCMKVKSESEVAQSCPTLRDSMDCSLPGSSVHGIFQARILEWRAIAFSSLPLVPLKNDLILAQMVPLHEMFSNSLSRNLHTCIKIIAVHTVFISRISTRPYKRE